MTSSVLLDSSVWVEIFSGRKLAGRCEAERTKAKQVHVPTVVIFEVYRKIAKSTSDDQALSVVAIMSQNHVVDLSREIALTAADLSLAHDLAMADAFVLAHAQSERARLITLDNDFTGIPGVLVLR